MNNQLNIQLNEKDKQQYLHGIYKEVLDTFNTLWDDLEEQPMKFSEYMNYYNHAVVTNTAHAWRVGVQAEEFIRTSLSMVEGIRVTNTTEKIDMYYGADMKVQQDIDGKAASLYVDIKTNTEFENGIKYLHHNGTMVEDRESASKFTFSFGQVYFALKERHYYFFKYEKPVVVMYIQDYQQDYNKELRDGEMNLLALILTTINKWMVEEGYAYRASQFIKPNRKLLK